jgi:hypothetical protein
MLDSEQPVDMSEVRKIVDTSDVLLIRFATVDKRLLIDFRSRNGSDSGHDDIGPMVTLVGRVSSTEQRFKELKQLRPQLPLPNHIMSFRWPRRVSSLETSGVLEWIVSRLSAMGHEQMQGECRELVAQLRQVEGSQIVAAIRGDGYQTLWERKA